VLVLVLMVLMVLVLVLVLVEMVRIPLTQTLRPVLSTRQWQRELLVQSQW
jgi:hypothetical protein